MTEQKNLMGVAGWLIVVAIGIIAGPFRIALDSAIYREIFLTGKWQALTTQGGEAYHPLWAPIIIGEILVNSVLIFVWLYVAYKFFTKSQSFPRWYIGTTLGSLFFTLADMLVTMLVVPSQSLLDPDAVANLVQLLIPTVVWVPYMLMSKRVRATFVE